uniref:CUB domain-containing protein n=1 Tax=Echinostoma caproni TaxID=27848 RepID=A0A183AWT3_9TREM
LISTAVIRGSRDDAQASSSVPDIKRLMDDAMMAPRTLTPGSSNDFLVPSAPCVPEVYPLETLHNALTLSQLEAFFARLTTRKFPTPFTSPQHPSTPVAYYHHYHDSAGSLISAFQTNTSTTELLISDEHQMDAAPTDLVLANPYMKTSCQAESALAPTTAVFRLVTVHRPSDTTTDGFAEPDSETAMDNVWLDDAKVSALEWCFYITPLDQRVSIRIGFVEI